MKNRLPRGLIAEYNVVIPDTFNGCPVVGIMENAFKGNTVIQSVTIPDSVEFIDSFAFSECGNLSSVTIGSGIERIETYAFYHCDNLTQFHLRPCGLVQCHSKQQRIKSSVLCP